MKNLKPRTKNLNLQHQTLKLLFFGFIFGVFIFTFGFARALTPQEERSQLEKELELLEQQIGQYEQDISKTQQEKKTLQNQISILKNKIAKVNLQISQSNKVIGDLKVQIADTTSSIEKTSQEIEVQKEQLADILFSLYEQDQKSLAEILLAGPSLSAFFDNVAALESLHAKNRELLLSIENLNAYLHSQKESLETDKVEEENFVKIQILQKQQSQQESKEQERLLNITKGKESEYQKLLGDTKKKAQEIRSRIFELIGVPKAPTFGEALEIAEFVSKQTGVRPAFLLAVLTQESNLGKNVGQCYLKNTETGSGVNVGSGASVAKVMKPSRDIKPFLEITQDLGRDPFNTQVSCPIPSVGGWGGAMGPAQFIPSTWMLYKSKIDALAGKAADPWNVRDAFFAAGVLLADSGATQQTYNAEWRAALRYFSGTVNTRYRFYGDSVMAIASRYEEDIKTLRR